MKWSDQANAAIKKVPFFVRRRVRERVEKEAQAAGKTRVSIADVKATQARYLKTMRDKIKGYQVDACFGTSGCPHRTEDSTRLVEAIEQCLVEADLLGFLKRRVDGDLKFHHEFRVSIADCPNACSQPQIKDVGIIGAAVPGVTEIPCSACGACQDACREDAMVMLSSGELSAIDTARCLQCGACMAACPTGTLSTVAKGYRVLIGGRLGRHPRLARALPGTYDVATVLEMLEDFIAFYKRHCTHGQRFAHLLSETDIDRFAEKWGD